MSRCSATERPTHRFGDSGDCAFRFVKHPLRTTQTQQAPFDGERERSSGRPSPAVIGCDSSKHDNDLLDLAAGVGEHPFVPSRIVERHRSSEERVHEVLSRR
jgi:hypothetical protein